MSGLDQRLLRAHEAGDCAILARLYREAAGSTEGTAAAFFLTHAFVFALEAGLPEAPGIEAELRAMGRL